MSYPYVPVAYIDKGTITGTNAAGFEKVPDLLRNRSKSNGFYLNILVVGRRGLGSTTLVNSLFGVKDADRNRPDGLTQHKMQLFENEICLTVSITMYHDTNPDVVAQYIKKMYAEHYHNEVNHNKQEDCRVHACIYLLPTDSIYPSEIRMLKVLGQHCNLIPVIPKADSFSTTELARYKSKIASLLVQHEICTFKPPQYLDDEEFSREVEDLKSRMPLAVWASDEEFDNVDGKKLGRLYPWGFLSLDDEVHNDFLRLRRLLIANHHDDLIHTTDTRYYDRFRKEIIEQEKISGYSNTRRIEKIRAEMERILTERNSVIISTLENEVQQLEQEISNRKTRTLLNSERMNLFNKR